MSVTSQASNISNGNSRQQLDDGEQDPQSWFLPIDSGTPVMQSETEYLLRQQTIEELTLCYAPVVVGDRAWSVDPRVSRPLNQHHVDRLERIYDSQSCNRTPWPIILITPSTNIVNLEEFKKGGSALSIDELLAESTRTGTWPVLRFHDDALVWLVAGQHRIYALISFVRKRKGRLEEKAHLWWWARVLNKDKLEGETHPRFQLALQHLASNTLEIRAGATPLETWRTLSRLTLAAIDITSPAFERTVRDQFAADHGLARLFLDLTWRKTINALTQYRPWDSLKSYSPFVGMFDSAAAGIHLANLMFTVGVLESASHLSPSMHTNHHADSAVSQRRAASDNESVPQSQMAMMTLSIWATRGFFWWQNSAFMKRIHSDGYLEFLRTAMMSAKQAAVRLDEHNHVPAIKAHRHGLCDGEDWNRYDPPQQYTGRYEHTPGCVPYSETVLVAATFDIDVVESCSTLQEQYRRQLIQHVYDRLEAGSGYLIYAPQMIRAVQEYLKQFDGVWTEGSLDTGRTSDALCNIPTVKDSSCVCLGHLDTLLRANCRNAEVVYGKVFTPGSSAGSAATCPDNFNILLPVAYGWTFHVYYQSSVWIELSQSRWLHQSNRLNKRH
ncbi:hypothetical protein CALCODRAFT_506170 [Calocera cornea HHB12733]|uniref:Uncharacterized protein n=1 Tax=Calocera cornea HHB12733 TaxID=1353952 RepID=A0A165JBB4_9BASI|nr:hypothetical protein CALCODRAFT_506170 [Calocera cornea HHB12733]